MDFSKMFLGFIFLVLAFCYQKFQNLSQNMPKPNFDPKEYWGKGNVKDYTEVEHLKPFIVHHKGDVSMTV